MSGTLASSYEPAVTPAAAARVVVVSSTPGFVLGAGVSGLASVTRSTVAPTTGLPVDAEIAEPVTVLDPLDRLITMLWTACPATMGTVVVRPR